MLYGVVAAGFKDVIEPDEVALYIRIGVGDAIAHTGLGSEVDNDVELVLLKQPVDRGLVGNIALDKSPKPITGARPG